MKHKKLTQDRVVYFINYVMLAVFLIIVLYPLIYIISCSFSSGDALMSGKVKLFPVEPTLQSYRAIVYTLVGTVISMVLTLFAAYPLSRSDFRGKKVFTVIILFTMMFSGGLIPTYLLVKSLHMLNTIWAVVLPGAVSAYNVIVARTFFANTIPKELQEAAEMDGCADFLFFIKIVIPLSTPIIAVLSLWVIVGLWNSYFWPMIYLDSQELYPLQLVLRRILLLSQINLNQTNIDPETIRKNQYLGEMLKYGTIIVSTLPLMIIYPFVQKYFVKGVMIGSMKG